MIMGIDPGWSGGIAIIDNEGKASAKGFTKLTEKDIYEIMYEKADYQFDTHSVKMCYIEKVHAMPQSGRASMFKFGHNYGFLRGVLTALYIPFTEVSPLKWQTFLGCRTGGDKNVTKRRAQQLYPSLKITHAIADALLIATYGFKQEVELLT